MRGIFHRTSIRKYQSQSVEPEKIESLLRAAMAAPSAVNQQPWEYYVVTRENILQALSETSPYAVCAAKAPLAFVACYHTDCGYPNLAPLDLSASVENLLIQADELELGAVWLGIAPFPERMEKVREILQLPKHLEAFAVIPCGYPLKEKEQENRYNESRVHYIR